MALELLYTSAPRGLRPGTSGFCTVVRSRGLSEALQRRLEALSGYRPLEGASTSPVAHAHWRLRVGGRVLDVLSRVAPCGVDHSGRENKLAHHLLIEPHERAAAGPSWLLRDGRWLRTSWDGTVGECEPVRDLPQGDQEPRRCENWERACGDAGWAGALADRFLRDGSKPVWLLYEPGLDVLALVDEALALLPPDRRWEVGFHTFFDTLPPGVECRWRWCAHGSRAVQRAAQAGGEVWDLRRLGTCRDGGTLVRRARGEQPARVSAPARPRVRPAPSAPRAGRRRAARRRERGHDREPLTLLPVETERESGGWEPVHPEDGWAAAPPARRSPWPMAAAAVLFVAAVALAAWWTWRRGQEAASPDAAALAAAEQDLLQRGEGRGAPQAADRRENGAGGRASRDGSRRVSARGAANGKRPGAQAGGEAPEQASAAPASPGAAAGGREESSTGASPAVPTGTASGGTEEASRRPPSETAQATAPVPVTSTPSPQPTPAATAGASAQQGTHDGGGTEEGHAEAKVRRPEEVAEKICDDPLVYYGDPTAITETETAVVLGTPAMSPVEIESWVVFLPPTWLSAPESARRSSEPNDVFGEKKSNAANGSEGTLEHHGIAAHIAQEAAPELFVRRNGSPSAERLDPIAFAAFGLRLTNSEGAALQFQEPVSRNVTLDPRQDRAEVKVPATDFLGTHLPPTLRDDVGLWVRHVTPVIGLESATAPAGRHLPPSNRTVVHFERGQGWISGRARSKGTPRIALEATAKLLPRAAGFSLQLDKRMELLPEVLLPLWRRLQDPKTPPSDGTVQYLLRRLTQSGDSEFGPLSEPERQLLFTRVVILTLRMFTEAAGFQKADASFFVRDPKYTLEQDRLRRSVRRLMRGLDHPALKRLNAWREATKAFYESELQGRVPKREENKWPLRAAWQSNPTETRRTLEEHVEETERTLQNLTPLTLRLFLRKKTKKTQEDSNPAAALLYATIRVNWRPPNVPDESKQRQPGQNAEKGKSRK